MSICQPHCVWDAVTRGTFKDHVGPDGLTGAADIYGLLFVLEGVTWGPEGIPTASSLRIERANGTSPGPVTVDFPIPWPSFQSICRSIPGYRDPTEELRANEPHTLLGTTAAVIRDLNDVYRDRYPVNFTTIDTRGMPVENNARNRFLTEYRTYTNALHQTYVDTAAPVQDIQLDPWVDTATAPRDPVEGPNRGDEIHLNPDRLFVGAAGPHPAPGDVVTLGTRGTITAMNGQPVEPLDVRAGDLITMRVTRDDLIDDIGITWTQV